jgi:hypothetical protein
MSKVLANPKADEEWCEMVAQFAADELLAGGIIRADQWDHAKQIIRQQTFVQLVSNCYPVGDLNSK